MGKVKVLYKPVGKPGEVQTIEDDYKVMQEMCGGFFSSYSVTSFVAEPELLNVVLYCHDTGKLIGLPANCFIGRELLVGNVIFYAFDEHGGGMDITDRQAQLVLNNIVDLCYEESVPV